MWCASKAHSTEYCYLQCTKVDPFIPSVMIEPGIHLFEWVAKKFDFFFNETVK